MHKSARDFERSAAPEVPRLRSQRRAAGVWCCVGSRLVGVGLSAASGSVADTQVLRPACNRSGAGGLRHGRDVATGVRSRAGRSGSRRVRSALQAAARDVGLELRGDGRLADLARQLANQSAPDIETLTASARAFGVSEIAIEFRIVRSAAARRWHASPASVGRHIARAARHAFGAFIADDGRSASVVLTRRPFSLRTGAAAFAVGATLVLRGRLAATYQNPKLVVTGRSERVELARRRKA